MINHQDIDVNTMRLCYIDSRDNFAWFTSIDLKSQWGDDWDDAPYEHNAGEPYEDHYVTSDGKRDRVNHHLLKVSWDGPYSTPNVVGAPNSTWSIQGINAGCVAWLIPDVWNSAEYVVEPIHAGVTIFEFIRKIRNAGGEVYIPVSLMSKFAGV